MRPTPPAGGYGKPRTIAVDIAIVVPATLDRLGRPVRVGGGRGDARRVARCWGGGGGAKVSLSCLALRAALHDWVSSLADFHVRIPDALAARFDASEVVAAGGRSARVRRLIEADVEDRVEA